MLRISDLLADTALELSLIVPGPEEALSSEVLWLHNTELPDPSFYIREGELVLTNGLWRDVVSGADFVASVIAARAAGLLFGLTPQTPDVPADLVAACSAAELTLITVSIGVPFSAVTQAAAKIQSAARHDALAGTVRLGDALATVISRGGGVSGVLEVLRADHDLPVAVVNRRGHQLASVAGDMDAEFLHACAGALAQHPPPLEMRQPSSGPAALFLIEGAMGDIDAGLFCLKPMSELTQEERTALEQVSRFLSLEVAKQQAIQAIEMRFSSELLEMILSGPVRSIELAGRLRAFGVDPSGPLAVLVVAPDDGRTLSGGQVGEIQNFFLSRGIAAVVAAGSQDAVIIFPWNRNEIALKELATALSMTVGPRESGTRSVVGISELAEEASGLKEQLVRAREACRVLARRPAGPSAASFSEVGTHTMLLGLHEPGVLRRFADDELSALRRYDARNGTDLEHTLRTYLERDGHWVIAAADLFIHVNTLRNRIARVSELTGRDLNRFEDRVNLFLALEADSMS